MTNKLKMTKKRQVEELKAEIQTLERRLDEFIEEAYKKNREAIAIGDVSQTSIYYHACARFPFNKKLEQLKKQLEDLMKSGKKG